MQIKPVEFEEPPTQPPRATGTAASVGPAEWEVPIPQGGAPAWPGLTEEEARQDGPPAPKPNEALQEQSKRSFQQYRTAARGVHSVLSTFYKTGQVPEYFGLFRVSLFLQVVVRFS